MRMFTNQNSQPELIEWFVESGEFWAGRMQNAGKGPGFQFKTPSGLVKLSGGRIRGLSHDFDFGVITWLLDVAVRDEGTSPYQREIQGEMPTEVERETLKQIVRGVFTSLSKDVYASSPIRSQPRRTYELLKDTPNPEGEHIPMILSKIYGHKEWEKMGELLEAFGEASGLFDTVQIRRLGRQESSPFQILIKINGPAFNLVDVGYGVSQSLPLVVEMLQRQRTIFLLQQPEVHLHPKAQAELGSFIGGLVKTQKMLAFCILSGVGVMWRFILFVLMRLAISNVPR